MAEDDAKTPESTDPSAADDGSEGDEASSPEAAESAAAAEEEAAVAARAKAEAAAKAKAEKAAIEAAKPTWEKDPVTPEWETADDDLVVQALREAFPNAISAARTYAGDLVVDIERADIRTVCQSLKTDHAYHLLIDICGADHPDRESGRFDVIYQAFNLEATRRIRLRVVTDEATPVPSVCSVWKGANWPEREVFDMYGVQFSDHPDLSRILLWDGFNGFPLRKDFPVEGIDTGSAIYPEFYEEEAGPVAGTGTGWKPPEEPEESEPTEPVAVDDGGKSADS